MRRCRILFSLLVMVSLSPLYASDYTLESAAQEAAARISGRINHGNIAVVNISSGNGNTSLQIIRWLESKLVNSGRLEIVSRQQVNAVLREQNFGLSGYVDDESAQKIGHLVGAVYVLSGELINVGGDNFLNIQVLEVETARLVYSDSFKIRKERRAPARF